MNWRTTFTLVGLLVSAVLILGFQQCSRVQFDKETDSLGGRLCIQDSDAGCVEKQKALALGLLTRNMACVMCHTKIHGDISGFGTMTFRSDSAGQILGNLYAADLKLQKWKKNNQTNLNELDPDFIDNVSNPNLIAQVLPELSFENIINLPNGDMAIRPGEKHNTFSNVTFEGGGDFYTLTHHEPGKREIAREKILRNSQTFEPIIKPSDFPSLKVDLCKSKANGYIRLPSGEVLSSPIQGNLILMHGQKINFPLTTGPNTAFNDYDQTCPSNKTLELVGEVVVDGDLVLAGCLTGQGTLYASGNIYIPDDLKNINSAFPYPSTSDEEILREAANDQRHKDMISLGAKEFILIGPLNLNVIVHEEQDRVFADNQSSLERLYSWLSTDMTSSQSIYEEKFLKKTYYDSALKRDIKKSFDSTPGAIALIEANLYANLGVVATLLKGSTSNIVLNGSVISPNFSFLATSSAYDLLDSNGVMATNPFNGRSFDHTEINQDFRLKYTSAGYECHRLN